MLQGSMSDASVVDLVEGDLLLYQGGTPAPVKHYDLLFFVFGEKTNT